MFVTRRSLLAGLGAALVARPGFAAGQEPLKAVATTGMIADAARVVGGDLVEVRGLMGPGVDPHSYRQTRTDIVAMTRADLVLWHGLFLEAQMQSFFHDLARRRAVVPVAEALPKSELHAHDDYKDKYDPHVWMSPRLWQQVVRSVQSALSDVRPDSAATFAANADAHVAELARLDAYAATALAQIPAERRVLVTAHDAFGYFGAAYGIEVLGLQGISTESEAGLNRIADLVDTLVARNIGAVFVETSVSDRNMRALIEGAAAQGHTVRIGGELYSDAMGAPGTYEGTYIGMLDHNVTVIARALGSDVPAQGLNGRLAAGS
ncbi:metal ABC transporter solute-binding protein, Zn/Mn family [Arenibacterium halophilum]|uniref:Manganese transporter n=1 Tax=Arenibacterium halophilum TaxID=2583821 RepID=A0ABY2X7C3_9RHOB|nr:zinc ABC transporter substrate-binding protein [Arenibacterium halophilum]TMV10928.1 manganese transporter [Arenibacterium halophilum]